MKRKKWFVFILLALVQTVVFVWGLYLGIATGAAWGYLSAAAMLLAFVAMAYDGYKIRIRKRFENNDK